MPTSEARPANAMTGQPPATVIGLPAVSASAGGGQPPRDELVAIARQLLVPLQVIARHFGLQFTVELQEIP
ncbi:hypothetical protein [Nocardia sp. NPDC050435]|uniref:hypothetical protein n=1 Tax=Nocardia sp. NPDC050435 TaxID=3155040 RepID=UPI0033C90BD0